MFHLNIIVMFSKFLWFALGFVSGQAIAPKFNLITWTKSKIQNMKGGGI